MKQKLVTLLMCISALGFLVFRNVDQLDQTREFAPLIEDPGGS